MAQGLNLREKRCEMVDWGVERGRAAMAAFPTTENLRAYGKVNKKYRVGSGGSKEEGAPQWPLSQTKEMELQLSAKLERMAYRNGRIPRSSRWTGREGECRRGPTGDELKRAAHRNGRFPW